MNDNMANTVYTAKMSSLVSFRRAQASAVALTLLVSGGMVLLATAVAPVAARAQDGTTTAAPYKIGVDDSIEISVVDHPDATRTYQVPSDGVIEPLMGGDLKVVGMTVKELRAHMTKAFAKKYYQPQVIINVHPTVQIVHVLGSGVKSGGNLTLKPGSNLRDVIASAGGLIFDRPEDFKATLFRSGSSTEIPIDVAKLYANDPAQNVDIHSGDTVYVESKEMAVTNIQVIGQVGKPGQILAPHDESLVTVLQEAGDPLPTAALSHVQIVHEGVTTNVDMTNYRKTGKYLVDGKEATLNIVGGDKIIVPENTNKYYMTGGGAGTGTHLYPDDRKLTVYTAFTDSGGSTEGVDLKKVTLIHPLADNTTQTTTVNIQDMLKTGDFSKDQPVVPGDTVYIPHTAPRKGLSAGEAIGLFSGVVGLIYTLKAIH